MGRGGAVGVVLVVAVSTLLAKDDVVVVVGQLTPFLCHDLAAELASQMLMI